MSILKEKISDRFTILIGFFIVFGLIIILQLVNLQLIHGKEYEEESQRRLLNERKVKAPRGNINDRNGIPIASNRMGFIVQVVKTKSLEVDQLNDIILRTINIFEKNNDTYYKSFENYLSFNPIQFGPYINKSQTKTEKWLKEMAYKAKDVESLKTPQDAFKYLRKVVYKIDDRYTDEEAYKIMAVRYEIRGYSVLRPICIAKDVSRETVAELEERHNEFTGVITEVEPMRKYVDASTIAHVIGYVRGIDAEEYSKLKVDGYDMNDNVGKSGIELAAEKYLKGNDGIKNVEIDEQGRQMEQLNENPAKPGSTVELTIDSKIQKAAMESLEKNINLIKKGADYKKNFGDAFAGAAVAIDVDNGEVLAMASYPSYDPSIFLAGKDNKEAQNEITKLFTDSENVPSLNRAIQGRYAPGSTFKPLTAIAALEEGVITSQTQIYDSGKTNIGGRDFWCMEYNKRTGQGAHGNLTLERALGTSCNIFFHEIGFRTGIDKIDKWAKYFGLGEYTGIDIAGESKGVLASKEYKMKVRNDDWRPADTAQTSIGQFDNAFTPLQLANYVSSLANGGKLYKPHLIKRVIKADNSIEVETAAEFKQIPVDQITLNAVNQGMVAVTNAVDGTAVGVFSDLPFKVAGKTGTAETGFESKHSSNALFVCYAPAEKPKIAVAVVVERGAWGAFTAPIAHDILAEYFHVNNNSNAASISDKVKVDNVQFTR